MDSTRGKNIKANTSCRRKSHSMLARAVGLQILSRSCVWENFRLAVLIQS